MQENKDIKYLSKDFFDFKQSLIDYAKTYYPTTYNDFSDAQPGSIFLDMAAYVGDVLSFYLDRTLQENFLAYAKDRDNLISLAYQLGYRPKVSSTSIVKLDVFQLVPSKISGSTATPDFNYALVLDKESIIGSNSNSDIQFITQNLVDFTFSSSMDPTEISVYQVNNISNLPEYYLLKKSVNAISGKINTEEFTFGSPERFPKITIQNEDIIYVLDIVDSDNNKWYEVPYLAQNIVFDEVKNDPINEPFMSQYNSSVPYMLRYRKVQKRYVTRFVNETTLDIEFGSGVNSSADEEILPNSDNVGMGLVDSISKLNYAFDPSNFLYTKDYGISPSNTTLTVRYLTGGGLSSIVPSNDVNKSITLNIRTTSISDSLINQNVMDYVRQSIAFNNETPSSGGGNGDTVEDIRLNSLASFSTQMRNVSKEDYIIRSLSLPPRFGTISKVYHATEYETGDNIEYIDNNPFAINLYILSYDENKKLTNSSLALKENLKTYLSQYKMSTDAINIKDGYYINIGCHFDITVISSFNSREVLSNCLNSVKEYFNIDKWYMNRPIILNEIHNIISNIKGVQSVVKIDIINKYGENNGYSRYGYDIKSATRGNVIYPSLDPSVFECRYPDQDIYGRVVNI